MTRAKIASSAERLKSRYHYARNVLKRSPNNVLSRDEQVEVCYLIKRIEDYGFRFFPDHYLRDDVVRLERLAGREH